MHYLQTIQPQTARCAPFTASMNTIPLVAAKCHASGLTARNSHIAVTIADMAGMI
jgi:hypothetical protein